MLQQTDAETREPIDVMRNALAEEEWAVWHPGDATQYRVHVVRLNGGPHEGTMILLIAVGSDVVAVRYFPEDNYRHFRWSATAWRQSRLNPDGQYDWWPKVVKPLLEAVGAA